MRVLYQSSHVEHIVYSSAAHVQPQQCFLNMFYIAWRYL